jgi:DnaJ-class molecular chaperone
MPSDSTVKDAYRTLHVDEDATNEEIRKAYRELVFKHHPDRKKSETAKANASTRFKQIQAAWDTISASRGIT